MDVLSLGDISLQDTQQTRVGKASQEHHLGEVCWEGNGAPASPFFSLS